MRARARMGGRGTAAGEQEPHGRFGMRLVAQAEQLVRAVHVDAVGEIGVSFGFTLENRREMEHVGWRVAAKQGVEYIAIQDAGRGGLDALLAHLAD